MPKANRVIDQAAEIVADVTNFDGNLSASDTTVQTALETLDELSAGGAITVDTIANILATTPDAGTLAFATDTAMMGGKRLFLYDGANWRQIEFIMQAKDTESMGLPDQRTSGIHEEYITDKQLSNVYLGGSIRTDNGGIRIDSTQDPDTFEIYLRGTWQTIIYDLTTDYGDFRHAPVDLAIQVWTGNSIQRSEFNDRPMIIEYNASMGANPPASYIDGGSF